MSLVQSVVPNLRQKDNYPIALPGLKSLTVLKKSN